MRGVLIVAITLLYGFVPGKCEECCPFKTVGKYNYLNVAHTGPVPGECLNKCAYIREGEHTGPIYCFAAGYEPSTCHGYTATTTQGTGGSTYTPTTGGSIYTPSIGGSTYTPSTGGSTYTPSTIRSNLTITENGTEIVQENNYDPQTEVFISSLPAHKDYDIATFLYHQASNTEMLKTSGTCQLSSKLSINVKTSVEHFGQNSRMIETERKTKYILKARKSRLGIKKREELILPAANNLCSDVPLVKTSEMEVNETEFEILKQDGLIIINNSRNSRICSEIEICSKEGPGACGNSGVYNEATGKTFTFHEVSDGVVCAKCNNKLGPNPQCLNNHFCDCNYITDKNRFFECSIQSNVNTSIQIDCFVNGTANGTPCPRNGGDIIQQTMRAQRRDEGFYIAINSPAFDDYGSLEVVMHARSNGYWHQGGLKNNRLMKLGNYCYISTIPKTLYPFEIAQGIQEIKAGQDVTDKSDEIDIYKVVKDEGPLTDILHPEISDQCPESNRKTFTLDYNNFEPNQNDIDSTQSKQLRDGQIIPLNPGSSEHFVQTSVGSWRWPNNETKEVWYHETVHAVAAISSAIFVATGDTSAGRSQSAEILTEINGKYKSVEIVVSLNNCSKIPNFPYPTTSATGAMFNNLPHVCVGVTGGAPESGCYKFQVDGTWELAFNLTSPLNFGGASVVFEIGQQSLWWIVGGDPSGVGTVVWSGNPPVQDPNYNIKLPEAINLPCIAKINDKEAFITALTRSSSKQYAWTYNIETNVWTQLEYPEETRIGAACGVINKDNERVVVLAGGSNLLGVNSDTSEFLNLDKPNSNWEKGPNIGVGILGGSMVSIKDQQELLLIGGYDNTYLSKIWKLNSNLESWELVADLNIARYQPVVFPVPIGDLPTLCVPKEENN